MYNINILDKALQNLSVVDVQITDEVIKFISRIFYQYYYQSEIIFVLNILLHSF